MNHQPPGLRARRRTATALWIAATTAWALAPGCSLVLDAPMYLDVRVPRDATGFDATVMADATTLDASRDDVTVTEAGQDAPSTEAVFPDVPERDVTLPRDALDVPVPLDARRDVPDPMDVPAGETGTGEAGMSCSPMTGCPPGGVCCPRTNTCVPADCPTCCPGAVDAGPADVPAGCSSDLECGGGELCCTSTRRCYAASCLACCMFVAVDVQALDAVAGDGGMVEAGFPDAPGTDGRTLDAPPPADAMRPDASGMDAPPADGHPDSGPEMCGLFRCLLGLERCCLSELRCVPLLDPCL